MLSPGKPFTCPRWSRSAGQAGGKAFKARLAANGKPPIVIICAMARACRRRHP
jgi:hypothetical protein